MLPVWRGGRYAPRADGRGAQLGAGNAGVIFYTDILLPMIGLVLLWLAHQHSPPIRA